MPRGLSVSIYAVASSVAVLWLIQPMMLLGLGTAFAGLAPALAPLYGVLSAASAALHRIFRVFPELAVPRIPGAADAHTACHRAHHRRKRKFKADIAHCIAVACGHNDTCHRQRGKGIRRAVQPHTQCTDPDRHCGAG